MAYEQSVIDALISAPSENLSVEIKRWIDPNTNQGISKIAKGLLALRNQDGGFFVIGIDDKTLRPDAHRPANYKALFHPDLIQGIVSKYASDRFEIEVAWGIRDSEDYPVIVVPGGITAPVVSKSDLKDQDRLLVRESAVYVRTLHSNGLISSAEARSRDWPNLMERCFSNREADIGRFIRRHLSSVNSASLIDLISQTAKPPPTLRDRAEKLLDDGEIRYRAAINDRKLTGSQKALAEKSGFWSVGLVIDPPHPDALPDQNFGAIIGANNPQLSGWPVWLDARFNGKLEDRDKRKDSALEYLVVVSDWSNHIDFARLDPTGQFFLHRIHQDDSVPSRVTAGAVIDPLLVIIRVAEAMAVGISFAKGLGWVPQETRLGFGFRWHNLKGRILSVWSKPFYFDHLGGGKAEDEDVSSFVEFSLDTPVSALPQFIEEVTRKLFIAFNGATVRQDLIEQFVKDFFERKFG
jgi:hypothetical protein